MNKARAGFSFFELAASLAVLACVGLVVSQSSYHLQNILAKNNHKQQAMLIVGNSLERARALEHRTPQQLLTLLEQETRLSARPKFVPACKLVNERVHILITNEGGRLVYRMELQP